MTKKTVTESKADRDARLARYAKDGISNREIMEREGFNDITYTINKMKPYRSKPYPTAPKPYIAYGLDCESIPLRTALGHKVSKLIDNYGITETGAMLGISNVCHASAFDAAIHDWTLSQLQRLAKAEGQTLGQLLEEITEKYRVQPWTERKPGKDDYRNCKAVLGDTSAIQYPPRQPNDPGRRSEGHAEAGGDKPCDPTTDSSI